MKVENQKDHSSKELEVRKEPNAYLNEMMAKDALLYLQKVNFKRTGSRINMAVFDFLEKSGISPMMSPDDLGGYQLASEAADLQKMLLETGQPNTSLRSVIRDFRHLLPLVAHGPQALLIDSYRPLLENLYEVDLGLKKYGYGKEVYRNITDNVKAARMMFESASIRISDKLMELYGNSSNLALFEGGAGNGAAMLTNVERFSSLPQLPKFLLSDIDEATRITAEDLFRSKGFDGQLPWMKVDIGNVDDLHKVQNELHGCEISVSVNFIIHETESIAENFFGAMSSGLPKAKLAISEFFLPENKSVDPRIPEWFIFMHKISGQHLRREEEFLEIAQRYGYSIFSRIDHQAVGNKPLVSTLFLEKK